MGDPSQAPGPSLPGPSGLGPEGPFGQLLRRRRPSSPPGGDPEGPKHIRRRVCLEEEAVSGPPTRPRGDPSQAPGPSLPGPSGLGPEGPFGQLLRRRRPSSPPGGDPEGPKHIRRRVCLEEEAPQRPLIQPAARSWREWLARPGPRPETQPVTTFRRRIYIEEEEES
ncbi:EBNA-LP [Papiine gammaherpesvirus 1]|uniref:EBNA-LP n=1 Tax=Cercopithecine herpesvirus 12 TaxID=106332 RepID=Q9Q5L0_CHV12|nr:EBNA-LP [Papiine gammaherpesvirus 1]AAF23951.1 EBNA-LP [Papiine gammaherpesvirus 1]